MERSRPHPHPHHTRVRWGGLQFGFLGWSRIKVIPAALPPIYLLLEAHATIPADLGHDGRPAQAKNTVE